MSTPFTPPTRAYVEHVAVRVRDIHWHIQFFYEVLGMDVREDAEGYHRETRLDRAN